MTRDAYNYWLKQQIAYPHLTPYALQKVATGITNARVEGVFSMLSAMDVSTRRTMSVDSLRQLYVRGNTHLVADIRTDAVNCVLSLVITAATAKPSAGVAAKPSAGGAAKPSAGGTVLSRRNQHFQGQSARTARRIRSR